MAGNGAPVAADVQVGCCCLFPEDAAAWMRGGVYINSPVLMELISNAFGRTCNRFVMTVVHRVYPSNYVGRACASQKLFGRLEIVLSPQTQKIVTTTLYRLLPSNVKDRDDPLHTHLLLIHTHFPIIHSHPHIHPSIHLCHPIITHSSPQRHLCLPSPSLPSRRDHTSSTFDSSLAPPYPTTSFPRSCPASGLVKAMAHAIH